MINHPFQDCKTATLELADSIQPFGMLLVADASGAIQAASSNAEAWLGEPAQALFGRDWRSLLPAGDGLEPAAFDPQAGLAGSVLRGFRLRGRDLLAAVHRSGAHILIEIEAGSFAPESSEQLSRGIAELAASESVPAAAEALMHAVARIGGFDRTMLYQFLPDWHGKVIAEVCRPGVHGYLGLHFPAGDIPPNARALYRRKRQRIIADVAAPAVPVQAACPGLTVDLSWSELRAVHPVHLEYLRNMGVAASFSVSIVVAGELWGLIACHHLQPRRVSFAERQLCEHLADVAGMHVRDLRRLEREQARHAHHQERIHASLELAASGHGKRGIASQLARFRAAFKASGAWLCLEEGRFHSGELPEPADLGVLEAWLERCGRSEIIARHSIADELAARPSLVRLASGMLFIPLMGREYLLLMRAERIETVTWAGRPPPPEASGQPPLGPRTSFELWREQNHGCAPAWSEADIEAAGQLRQTLLEYIERDRLRRLALTDPLTGLSNRNTFERKLVEAIEVSVAGEGLAALLMIDLDRFKPVNDTYGHAVGDALLVAVADRLREQVRAGDVVARLGGDEFAIIQPRLGAVTDAVAAAERVLAAIAAPYLLHGHTVEIGASIGVAICPYDAVDRDELLENADLALYQVKRSGRNGYRLYDSERPAGGS